MSGVPGQVRTFICGTPGLARWLRYDISVKSKENQWAASLLSTGVQSPVDS